MPDILMLKYKTDHQFSRRRSITGHRNFGQRKTVVRTRRLSIVGWACFLCPTLRCSNMAAFRIWPRILLHRIPKCE